MHMRYMAEFLRGLSLNGTTPKSLWMAGPSVSSEDQAAAPNQSSEETQRLREMDGRLVKQDHQLRELIILKDTQVRDVKCLKLVFRCTVK